MIRGLAVSVLSFFVICLYAQKDTIFLTDTIFSSVRIINVDEDNVRYLKIDSIANTKQIKVLSLEDIKSIVYQDEKIEVFCDLMSRKKFLGTEEQITINYGTRDSLWIDPKIYTLMSKDLIKYNSIIDALNYMGNEGWEVLRSYSTSHNSYTVEHYILKKEIIK